MGKFIDLTGKRYGKLTAVSFLGQREKRSYWKCTCDCGQTVEVRADRLNSGNTQSCGCRQKEMASNLGKRRYEAGLTHKFTSENNPMKNPENRAKLSRARTGVPMPSVRGENNPSKRQEVREKISNAKKGKPCPNGSAAKQGDKNPSWKSELTEEERQKNKSRLSGSNEYRVFKVSVTIRDNHACIICGHRASKDMRVHHLNSYKNDIKNRTNPDNAVLLCKKCHDMGQDGSFHSIYGRINNTKQQFEEFSKNKRTI